MIGNKFWLRGVLYKTGNQEESIFFFSSSYYNPEQETQIAVGKDYSFCLLKVLVANWISSPYQFWIEKYSCNDTAIHNEVPLC